MISYFQICQIFEAHNAKLKCKVVQRLVLYLRTHCLSNNNSSGEIDVLNLDYSGEYSTLPCTIQLAFRMVFGVLVISVNRITPIARSFFRFPSDLSVFRWKSYISSEELNTS